MRAYIELAKMFKERNNVPYEGYLIGKVIADFPDIKIELDKNIILDKSHLVFSAHVLSGYNREYEISEADLQFRDTDCGQTEVASAHSHEIASLNVDSQMVTSSGKITWTDTIVKNDYVILIPSHNSQSFVVIDKAVILDVSGDRGGASG
ncbi:DUF2577 domain-containing protein [Bacillus infantis]|uniref:DUF2577 domain-containing protein n=1 Tax=Bacillus infantis TaxID=324767 RepID=UPI003CECA3D6